MLDFLEKQSNDSIKSFRIARAIGSCIPDTNETARLLNYLTHFGRISLNLNGNYFIEYKTDTEHSQQGFRFRYIEDLVEIIKSLSEEELNIEELSNSLNRDVADLKIELEFLKLITSKGRVLLEGSKYIPSVFLESWEESGN